MRKTITTRATWQVAVSWMALHQMNWWQLRETAVYERSRREAAWLEMLRRSAKVYGCSRPTREWVRNHG